jgi:hypothetical protein
VFVSVYVSDGDTGMLEALDLSESFTLDLFFADLTTKKGADEVEERGAEGLLIRAEKRWDAYGIGGGRAIGEDNVAADTDGGIGAGESGGIIEGGAGGHERGGGKGSAAVKLDDGAIDAGGEAEVVCVDDEAGGHDFELDEWWMLLARHFWHS